MYKSTFFYDCFLKLLKVIKYNSHFLRKSQLRSDPYGYGTPNFIQLTIFQQWVCKPSVAATEQFLGLSSINRVSCGIR